ncbi:MAG: inositol monophosphatase [Pirellulales bacterium]|nr:inositol monophosphatase [Pirellulales bacterium]
MREPLEKYLLVCEQAVRAGGAAVQRWIGKIEVSKKGPADLVTQADFASQEAVARTIRSSFPEHRLVGEEGSSPMAEGANSPYRWITDPLDGTTNYVHGIPHYAVSLALEREGELLVGAVWNPVLEECFTAAQGRGAWLNGEPIHTSRITDLSEALGVVGFPPGMKRGAPDLQVFLEAVIECQSVHRSGSAALNLCYLAAGRYDVFWTFSTHLWDVAAGVLLLREAGGAICRPDGGEYAIENDQFLSAANPALLSQLLAVVRRTLL